MDMDSDQKIKNLPIGNNSKKFKYENFNIMKNNTDPALLRASYLSNETIKRTQDFRETIHLRGIQRSKHIG
jgi:hypothetical protein